jgi:hypothetical protein
VHVFTPRTVVHLVPPIHSGNPTGPGKNYMVALGYPATFTERKTDWGEVVRTFLDAGTNPPNGAVIRYWLKAAPEGELTLRIRDAAGRLVRELSSEGTGSEPRLPKAAGLNRFVWNLRHAPARAVPGDVLTERALNGPVVPPGRYAVELIVGGQTHATTVEIRRDSKVTTPVADLEAACTFLLTVRDKLSEVHDAVNQIRDLRRQVEGWTSRGASLPAGAELAAGSRALLDQLAAIEQELIEPRAKADGDRLHYPTRLNVKISSLPSAVSSADFAPTRQAREVFDVLAAQADVVLARWRAILTGEVATFNALVRRLDVPAVIVPPAPAATTASPGAPSGACP